MPATAGPHHPVDHRELMRKVERLVEAIEAERGNATSTVHRVTEGIIDHFERELGIYGGRIYARSGEDYVLRDTFGRAKEVPPGLRVPHTYPPIAACLERGAVYVDPTDPGVDHELERQLGVEEFACVAVGEGEYVLAFNVSPGAARDDVVFSLQILRHSVSQKLRQERMAEVFREARRIQSSILPRKAPEFPPFEMAGHSEPMESVGGDFFDLIEITDKILGLAIADVSGHGLPAALQVRDVHMGLRMGMARDFKIVRTVERLNTIIHQSTLTSRFVALFYGELEPNGTFIYVNAGHVAPFHLKASDGTVRLLEEGGLVLGPLPDSTYERGFVQLAEGDLLVLFTDGIVEARATGSDEELGLERLLAVARENAARPPAAIVDAIFAAVDEFTASAPAQDDRTVLVVKRV